MSMTDLKAKTYVGIIGAGISGLTTAYQLKKHGIDFEILEADGDVGRLIVIQRRLQAAYAALSIRSTASCPKVSTHSR